MFPATCLCVPVFEFCGLFVLPYHGMFLIEGITINCIYHHDHFYVLETFTEKMKIIIQKTFIFSLQQKNQLCPQQKQQQQSILQRPLHNRAVKNQVQRKQQRLRICQQ